MSAVLQLAAARPEPSPLRLLLLTEAGQWVAICLEHDIVTQGDDQDDALAAFAATWFSESRDQSSPAVRCTPFPQRIAPPPNDPPWSYVDRFEAGELARPDWRCLEYDAATRSQFERSFEVRVVRE